MLFGYGLPDGMRSHHLALQLHQLLRHDPDELPGQDRLLRLPMRRQGLHDYCRLRYRPVLRFGSLL